MREDELWELDELESDEEELWELDKLESASLDSNARGTTGKRAHDASCSSDESNLGERPSKKGPGRYSNFLAHEDAELFFFAFDDDGAASGANRHDGLPVARLRWAPRDAEFTRFTINNARVPNTVAGRRKLQQRLHVLIKRHEAEGAEFLSAMRAACAGNHAFALELEAGLGLGGPRAAECDDCGAWCELSPTPSYWAQPSWKRLLIHCAGFWSLVLWLFAILCFIGGTWLLGVVNCLFALGQAAFEKWAVENRAAIEAKCGGKFTPFMLAEGLCVIAVAIFWPCIFWPCFDSSE